MVIYAPLEFESLSELDDSRHSGGIRLIRFISNSQITNDKQGNYQTLEALLNSDSISSLENEHRPISDILNTESVRVDRETIDIDTEF